MKICRTCGRIYQDFDYYCLNDNSKLVDYTEEEAFEDQTARMNQRYENPNKPTCPTCQSTDVQKISLISKAIGAGAFGLFSTTARSQFKCNNCGYKW